MQTDRNRSPHYNGILCPSRINRDSLPEEIKGRSVRASTRVYMYGLNGRYIKAFLSIKKASKEIGLSSASIVACCKGRATKGGRYRWSYEKLEKIEIKQTQRSSPILQFSIDGELIAEYTSLREASENTGANYKGISACIKEMQKTCKGFIWKRKYNGEDYE